MGEWIYVLVIKSFAVALGLGMVVFGLVLGIVAACTEVDS